MKTLKKSEEGAQTFIVRMPRAVDEVVFTVVANAEPPYTVGPNIFWLRAREIGTETWGQTIWTEMEANGRGRFVSKRITPCALWLEPGMTYEVEVAPETLRVIDFNLAVEVYGTQPRGVQEKPKERGMEMVEKKESLLENPIFLLAVMAIVFAGFLWMWMWRK